MNKEDPIKKSIHFPRTTSTTFLISHKVRHFDFIFLAPNAYQTYHPSRIVYSREKKKEKFMSIQKQRFENDLDREKKI